MAVFEQFNDKFLVDPLLEGFEKPLKDYFSKL